jgi:hypothetical protein
MVVGGSWWLASRPAEPVLPQDIALHRAKATEWLRRHEQQALADHNSALWWMLQSAARHSEDAYLAALVKRAITLQYGGANAREPWRRMLEPQAEVSAYSAVLSQLDDYQRFFHHALTCMPLPLSRGDTSQYLRQNMCAPMWQKVVAADPVCTTHQILGQMFYERTGCSPATGMVTLRRQLLDDVKLQLEWDPVMRDAHIQRVLVLVLNGRQAEIKPIWLHRILKSQEEDGGWLGYRRVPEVPSWMQPKLWRDTLVRWFPDRFPRRQAYFDFHASAQAILLLTLLQPPAVHPHAQSELMAPTMP